MRAALEDFTRDFNLRLPRIVAVLLRGSARIVRRTTSLYPFGVVFRLIPVRGPLPSISDHIAESVTVRGKRSDGRRALIAVAAQIVPGKFALPCIGHMLDVSIRVHLPMRMRRDQGPARGKTPTRLRSADLSRPISRRPQDLRRFLYSLSVLFP
jgi:hypothetical protein